MSVPGSAPARLRVGAVELAYETAGDPGDPPVVLVMGLGAQMHYWHDGLVAELARRGLFVVRFDNRDTGLSTHFDEQIDFATLGPDTPIPYSLSDMAADVAGLASELGSGSAHLVGISLGGMICQLAAIEHPERVRSLTSIASTTGDPTVGQSVPEVRATLFTPPAAPTREAAVEQALAVSRAIGSPGFPLDEEWHAWRAGRSFDRCYDPSGALRQAATLVSAADRTPGLRELEIPATVIHGRDDPLVDPSGGEATADAIPGAELLVIGGMGHDLPREIWPQVTNAIERTVRRGEDVRSGSAR